MQKDIFLSIDIDYWAMYYHGLNCHSNVMINYLNKILNLSLPTHIVVEHQEMLPFVNKSGCDFLINLDYHSDITDSTERLQKEFNEGTWINYVNENQRKTFLWIYPEKVCYDSSINVIGRGRCDVKHNPFTNKSLEVCGWEKTHRRLRRLPTKQELKRVKEVGICLSPEWSHPFDIEKAVELFKERELIDQKTYNKMKEQLEESRVDSMWF